MYLYYLLFLSQYIIVIISNYNIKNKDKLIIQKFYHNNEKLSEVIFFNFFIKLKILT